MSAAPNAEALAPEDVAAFLREHPRFLAERPDLYRALAPPERVHGERLADHMAAMLRAERAHAQAMSDRVTGVLSAGRASVGMTARVQEAVVALLRAERTAEGIVAELPPLLAVDAAALCVEGDLPGARGVPEGAVAGLLGSRAVVFRSDGSDRRMLHGEAAPLAQHDALVRVPGDGPPVLLALAARGAGALDPAQGAGALGFLGRAIAAALGR